MAEDHEVAIHIFTNCREFFPCNQGGSTLGITPSQGGNGRVENGLQVLEPGMTMGMMGNARQSSIQIGSNRM